MNKAASFKFFPGAARTDFKKKEPLQKDERAYTDSSETFNEHRAIPEHFIPLMQKNRLAAHILTRQLVKSPLEDMKTGGFSEDPMGETHPGVISTPHYVHKYPDRLLLLFSHKCPVKCRYCTRKRVSFQNKRVPFHLGDTRRYLLKNPQIHEVIFSGGDPLMEPPRTLLQACSSLGQIDQVKKIRFHTRLPLMRPQLLSPSLLAVFQEARRIVDEVIVVLHINHPLELTPQALFALNALKKQGVTLKSQSVLLRGVNDTEETLYELFSALAKVGVSPYYLHQLDRISGSAHFEVDIEKGRRLLEGLRARLPRCLIATYVQDGPSGKKKILDW